MRILFATDGSEHARLAEAFIGKLRGAKDGTVEVVSVSNALGIIGVGVPAISQPMLPEQTANLWNEMHQHAERVVEESAQRFEAKGISVVKSVLDGDVANEILNHVDETKPDLVVIGSRGENAFVAFVLGSVARKLVNHCPASVLVVRTYGESSAADSLARLEAESAMTALVAVDDSAGSEAAVEAAKRYAGAFSRIVTLCVRPMPNFPAAIAPMLAAMAIPDPQENAAAIADKAADTIATTGAKVESMNAHGHPAPEITRVAGEIGADVIILGATRHGTIERFLIGSVAYDVANSAPCAVLVARP